MKNILENLWYEYQSAIYAKQSRMEKDILERLVKYEEKLHASFNEEQMNLFKEYENYVIEINCISEKEAFIKGVRFATGYLIEALYKNQNG